MKIELISEGYKSAKCTINWIVLIRGSGTSRNQEIVEFLADVTACGTKAGR